MQLHLKTEIMRLTIYIPENFHFTLIEPSTWPIFSYQQVEGLLTQYVTNDAPSLPSSPPPRGQALAPSPRQVWEAVLALALCHNVTPVYDVDNNDQNAYEAQSGMETYTL